MQRNAETKPYIDEEIKSVALSLQPTNDKLAKLVLGERRRGTQDRRQLHTYIANDRRSGIADRRKEVVQVQKESELVKALFEILIIGHKKIADDIAEKSKEIDKRVENFIQSFNRQSKILFKSINLSINEALRRVRNRENDLNQQLNVKLQMLQRHIKLFEDKQKDILNQISKSNKQLHLAFFTIRDKHNTLETSFENLQDDIQNLREKMGNLIAELTKNFDSNLKCFEEDVRQEFENQYNDVERSVDAKVAEITNRFDKFSNSFKNMVISRHSFKLVWAGVLISILIGSIALLVSSMS